MRRLVRLALAATALVAAFVAVAPAAADDQAVTIADFAFNPSPVTVTVGDTVTWTNNDDVPHTATSAQGVVPAFDTGVLGNGDSATVTFATAGTFAYFCQIHPNMQGTVIVQPGAATTPATTAAGGAGDGSSPVAPAAGSGIDDDASPELTLAVVLGAVALLLAAGLGGAVALRRR